MLVHRNLASSSTGSLLTCRARPSQLSLLIYRVTSHLPCSSIATWPPHLQGHFSLAVFVHRNLASSYTGSLLTCCAHTVTRCVLRDNQCKTFALLFTLRASGRAQRSRVDRSRSTGRNKLCIWAAASLAEVGDTRIPVILLFEDADAEE